MLLRKDSMQATVLLNNPVPNICFCVQQWYNARSVTDSRKWRALGTDFYRFEAPAGSPRCNFDNSNTRHAISVHLRVRVGSSHCHLLSSLIIHMYYIFVVMNGPEYKDFDNKNTRL